MVLTDKEFDEAVTEVRETQKRIAQEEEREMERTLTEQLEDLRKDFGKCLDTVQQLISLQQLSAEHCKQLEQRVVELENKYSPIQPFG